MAPRLAGMTLAADSGELRHGGILFEMLLVSRIDALELLFGRLAVAEQRLVRDRVVVAHELLDEGLGVGNAQCLSERLVAVRLDAELACLDLGDGRVVVEADRLRERTLRQTGVLAERPQPQAGFSAKFGHVVCGTGLRLGGHKGMPRNWASIKRKGADPEGSAPNFAQIAL